MFVSFHSCSLRLATYCKHLQKLYITTSHPQHMQAFLLVPQNDQSWPLRQFTQLRYVPSACVPQLVWSHTLVRTQLDAGCTILTLGVMCGADGSEDVWIGAPKAKFDKIMQSQSFMKVIQKQFPALKAGVTMLKAQDKVHRKIT